MEQALLPRERIELVARARAASLSVSGGKKELARMLARRLLESGRAHAEECSGGPRLVPRVARELLSVLEDLDWSRLSAGAQRQSGRSSGASFVLGTTLGVLGSRGYDTPARVASKLGASRRVVKEGYYFARQAPQLRRLWRLCREAVAAVDPRYHFTSVQVNRDFEGRPTWIAGTSRTSTLCLWDPSGAAALSCPPTTRCGFAVWTRDCA